MGLELRGEVREADGDGVPEILSSEGESGNYGDLQVSSVDFGVGREALHDTGDTGGQIGLEQMGGQAVGQRL